MQTLRVVILLTAAVLSGVVRLAADEPAPPAGEQVVFLKKARIVQSRPIGRGVTGALRLTLTDGRLTHDAAFQSVEQDHLDAALQVWKDITFDFESTDTPDVVLVPSVGY